MKKWNGLLTVSVALLCVAAFNLAQATTPSGASGLTVTLDSSATPAIALNPPNLTFTNQAIGSTSTAQSITVSNGGTAQLTLSMAITGDFAKTATCGAKLAAGASCTVSVTFTPTATGTRTGSLTVTNNSVSTPYVVGLSGTSAAVPTATISASPASVTSGGSSTLTWSSTNATSCTASGGWTGTEATSGTKSVSPTTTTTYTLTCAGTGGTSSPANTTVTVGAPPAWSVPSISFTAGAGGTYNLATTLPSGTTTGGVFAVDSSGNALPSGVTLSTTGVLTNMASTAVTVTGVVFSYTY